MMKGTCTTKCSVREAREREASGDVSIYEATPETRGLRSMQRRIDMARAVKKHRRAADGRWEGPEEVRTLPVLEDTVAYLWMVGKEELAAAAGEEKEMLQLYDFLADRLQAIRKDLVVQGLSGGRAIAIYEHVVRFHILFDYILAPVYDEHLGLAALRSGLAKLMDLYRLHALSPSPLSSSNSLLAHVDEALAYHLLLQAYDTVRAAGSHAAGWEKLLLQLRRALAGLDPTGAFRNSNADDRRLVPPHTRLALRAVMALATENYVGLLRLFQRAATTPPAAMHEQPDPPLVLVRCLHHRLLPFVRRRLLELWSRTMFTKERMPLSETARLLCFDSPAQARAFAALHGVAVVVGAQGPAALGGGYVEPRRASVSLPALGQTHEERQRQRRASAPRQDMLVLGVPAETGLAALWGSLGGEMEGKIFA